jgi:hypothetical protein
MDIIYNLPGSTDYIRSLYPDPSQLNPSLGLKTVEDVIAHFTASSLAQDGIPINGAVTVVSLEVTYQVSFNISLEYEPQASNFLQMHIAQLSANCGGLAVLGAQRCQQTAAWNPMSGYPVNRSDGNSEWAVCLPLGMPLANHQAVTLLHYPPMVALKNANYLDNMTLRRWAQLLTCVGIAQPNLYHNIVDVNPIAAPGSGESEYPNDYFPIALTQLFFDDENSGTLYVRSMLELMLNPPQNASFPYTLPLLVCGSPLYDPQAPGWFRVRYKDQLPKDANGTPTVDVLQAGFVRINPTSPKLTPYMIANHMIAAGVTGVCGGDPSKIPNILKYEAQDLVAASFVAQYATEMSIDPGIALQNACRRWFGALDGNGAPNPPSADDKLTMCALAQMDLCFDPVKIAPMYTFEQAKERCQQAGGSGFSPCFGCGPVSAETPASGLSVKSIAGA